MAISAILTAVFGNILATRTWLKEITSSETVNEINDIFYNAFQEELNTHSQSKEISFLLRLERKKLIAFFEVEGKEDVTYKDLLFGDIHDKLSVVLFSILEEYKDQIDLDFCKKIVSATINNFQKEIYNQLSTKQTNYIILQKINRQEDFYNEILLRAKVVDEKVLTLLTENNQLLKNLFNGETPFYSQARKDIALETINPIIQEYYEQGKLSLINHEYKRAIKEFTKATELLLKHNGEDREGLYDFHDRIATCFELQGKSDTASEYFIKALAYRPNDSHALYRAYVAYDQLGGIEEKEEIERKIRNEHKDTPEHFLLSIYLDRMDTGLDLSGFEERGNIAFSENAEVQFSIARAYIESGNLEKYREFMYKVINLSTDEGVWSKPILAYNLSHPHVYMSSTHETKDYSAKIIAELREAITLYKEAWEILKTKSNKKTSADIALNISTIYLAFKEFDEAIHWVDIAIDACPSDFMVGHKVMYLYHKEDIEGALQECKKVKNIFVPELESTFVTYIELLFISELDRHEEAIELSYEYLAKNPNALNHTNIIHNLVTLLIDKERTEEAITYLDSQIKRDPKNKVLYLSKSKAYFVLRDINQSNQILDYILQEENKLPSNDIKFLYELGVQLYNVERFQDAIFVLEDIDPLKFETPMLEIYINCYRQLDRLDMALELCREIRQSRGIDLVISLLEVSILTQSRSYQEALKVAKEYHKNFPLNIPIRLNLCNLYLILGERQEASKIDLDIPLSKLDLRQIRYLVVFLGELGRRKKIFEMMYELWITQKSAEICEFIATGPLLEMTKEELKIEMVTPPCVVYLEEENSQVEEIYILLDSESADFDNRKEIGRTHPFYNLLIGKRQGDQIVIEIQRPIRTSVSKRIKGIQPLHHYIFQQAMKALATQYKGQTNSFALHPKNAETGVEQLMKIVGSREEDYQETVKWKNIVLDKYCNFQLPISGLSKMLNIPVVVLWYSLTKDQKIGIRYGSSPLSFEEEEILNRVIAKTEKGAFCVDITSILALYHSNVTEMILPVVGKFNIAQSTFDMIEEMNRNKKSVLSQINWRVNIPHLDGETVRHSLTQERYNELWEDIEKVSEWVKRYCNEPQPAMGRLAISPALQNRTITVLGETFFDTQLLASEKKYTIISDDFLYRLYCQEKNVNVVGSHSLFKCFRNSTTEIQMKNKFNQATCELLKLNYYFINPDQELVAYLAKDDDLFELMLGYFNEGVVSTESLLPISLRCIGILWASEMDLDLRGRRTNAIFNKVSSRVAPLLVYTFFENGIAYFNDNASCFEKCLKCWRDNMKEF